MVKQKKFWVVLLCFAAAGAGVWYYCASQTPEAKMRRAIEILADCASKSPGDGTTSGVVKLHGAMELFTDPSRLEIYPGMISGDISVGELQSHLARYRSSFDHVTVTAEVVSVRATAEDRGEMEFTGTLRGVLKSGQRVSEDRELYCEFRRDEKGKWRIARMQVRDILER